MPGYKERRQSLVVCKVDSNRHSVELRLVPRDWERERAIQNHIEVIRVVCVLPEVVCIDDDVTPNSLLDAGVELISPAGLQRLRGCVTENPVRQPARTGRAGQDQILVI